MASSQQPNYYPLIGKTVTYLSNSGKTKQGLLTEVKFDRWLDQLCADILKKKIFFIKLYDYIPVTRILGTSFDQLNLNNNVIPPSAPPSRSSQNSYQFGGIEFYKVDYGDFRIGHYVVWMLSERVGRPLMGILQMIGCDARGARWGIVQFDEKTSHLPKSIPETRRNQYMVNLEHLLTFEEWIATNDQLTGQETSPRKSLTLTEAESTNNLNLFENTDAGVDPTPVLQANIKSSTTSASQEDHQRKNNTNVLLPRQEKPKELKGIQGFNNSCYIDASIFALFVFNISFDAPLNNKESLREIDCIRNRALIIEIAQKLREENFVSAGEIQKLRNILVEKYGSSFQNSYKDAEEFIELLFVILGIPHLFQYKSGGGDYIHQIFLPSSWTPDDKKPFVMVQSLLGDSFKEHDVKLKAEPLTSFILKLPVSNGILIPSNGVVPNLTIDIGNILSGKNRRSVQMYLSAVICLHNHHFVAFARASISEENSPWVFMDSRPCDSSPDMVIFRNIEDIISRAEAALSENPFEEVDDLELPNGFRLFRDAYICIYSNSAE